MAQVLITGKGGKVKVKGPKGDKINVKGTGKVTIDDDGQVDLTDFDLKDTKW